MISRISRPNGLEMAQNYKKQREDVAKLEFRLVRGREDPRSIAKTKREGDSRDAKTRRQYKEKRCSMRENLLRV